MANIGKKWFLGRTSVDSLKVRIPLHNVTVLNSEIAEQHFLRVSAETGQICSEEFKRVAKSITDRGIKTRFLIENQVTAKQVVDQFLTIGFNAKTLKQLYPEGLTFENIKTAYEYIISLGQVSFTFEEFLKAECTDVDLKRDTKYSNLKDAVTYLEKCTKVSAKKDVGCEVFKSNTNMGIGWSDRETRNFKSNPYVKIYHKEKELKNKSTEFYEAFLQGYELENIVRLESTIKNRKHFKYFGVEDTTLKTVLTLSEAKKQEFLIGALQVHLQGSKRLKIERSGLTPMDEAMLNLVEQVMEFGRPYSGVRKRVSDVMTDRQSKYRILNKLDSLYKVHLEGSPQDKVNKKLEPFLEFLGIS